VRNIGKGLNSVTEVRLKADHRWCGPHRFSPSVFPFSSEEKRETVCFSILVAHRQTRDMQTTAVENCRRRTHMFPFLLPTVKLQSDRFIAGAKT
jgi:hypothetical protein